MIIGACDDLLFRELLKAPRLDLVDALQSPYRSERIARVTVALVHHSGHRTRFNPVDLVAIGGLVEGFEFDWVLLQ